MSELLKQAIADAKAVRATALSNAKAALEEHFAPKLQSMLSEKLAAEIAGEEAAAAAPAGAAPAPAPAPAPAAPAPAAPAPAAPAAAGATDLPPELAPAAPAAPAAPMAEVEEIMKELSDDGETNPPLAERKNAGKKAGNYDKKTSGHKTVDAGQEVVHATKLSTPGGPKAASGSRTASPDYTKKTSGHNTQDPQGASNEMVKLEESDEVNEVNDETLEEILKELEEGMEPQFPQTETTDTTDPVGGVDEVVDINELLGDDPEEEHGEEHGEEHDEPSEPSSGPSKMDMPLELDEVDIEALINKGDNAPVAEGDDGDPFDALEEQEAHEEIKKENISLKKEIAEYRSAVEFLRSQINEVNLLNAKLLYTNKLFKQVNLNNEQKLKVIESFDLTKSVREAKLVYATLAESINNGAKNAVKVETKPITKTVKNITEGLASKPVASTKPTKPAVIAEGADMASRFKKLAGIRS
jgi:hypothetical protein